MPTINPLPGPFPRATLHAHINSLVPIGSEDTAWGPRTIYETHEIETIRRNQWPDCPLCRSQRGAEALRLAQERRARRRQMVVCHHSWSGCTRRDELNMIPAEDSYSCDNCRLTYCSEHSHQAPSGVSEHRCERHGYVARCIEVYRCDSCDSGYCENCDHYCDSESESESDYGGDFRPVTLTFAGRPGSHPMAMGKRFIGYEIEVEGGHTVDLPDECGIEEDGSIQGIEVLTPPARGSALVVQTREVMSRLSSAGWYGAQSCGMHTHIDLRDKKDDMTFLSRLFATAYAVEDILYSVQQVDRHNNSYSRPLRSGYEFYDGYGMKASDFEFTYNRVPKTPQYARNLEEGRGSKWGNRYYGFNFHSVFHRGTLEVRIHEGCVDADQALMWAELLQAIVARVERGITYRKLERMLEMKATPAKVKVMARYFSFSANLTAWVMGHVERRINAGRMVDLSYTLGTPRRGKTPSLATLERRQNNQLPTTWSCHDCGAQIPLAERGGRSHPAWCRLSGAAYADRRGCPSDVYLWSGDVPLGQTARSLARQDNRVGRAMRAYIEQWRSGEPPRPVEAVNPLTGEVTTDNAQFLDRAYGAYNTVNAYNTANWSSLSLDGPDIDTDL